MKMSSGISLLDVLPVGKRFRELTLLVPSDSQEPYGSTKVEAERFLQSTLDALSSHIAVLDKNGQIIRVNAAWRDFAEINGFRAREFGIGMNYLKVCEDASVRHSKDAPIVSTGIRQIMNGQLNEFEMEYPCHSPVQRRWFVVRISRFDWYEEVRLIVAHQNVTELKQVQIELAESKQRIEAILENINNGILTINSRGVIDTANAAAARVFGYALDELQGLHVSQLFNEDFDGQTSFKQLDGEYGHEIIGRRKDGSNFPMYFALNELKLDEGTLYTCIIQDISVRKMMEKEIIEKERLSVSLEKERELRELKNRFLSMMSHELRTPLASISLSYDMLKKYGQVSTEEEKNQALDNIRTQVHYLTDMVADVMTLSRSESEGLELEPEDLDLITYCRDVVEEFQFNYHKTHQVEFDCPDTNIRAMIDRKMLRRAFTNLLSNALKYSPEGGVVRFYMYRQGDEAVIQVSDEGIGIPPEDLPRLFQPFHRARNVSNLPGTGLGLPITKQVVELHSGRISVQTEIGKGTQFTIHLPISRS